MAPLGFLAPTALPCSLSSSRPTSPPKRHRTHTPPVAARQRVIVELPRPLGIVLEEAAVLAPGQKRVVVSSVGAGSAASGVVRVGDVVVATSATFGDTTWPTKSLDGAISAIKSRCGDTVKLVLERDDDGPVSVAPPPSRSPPARHRPPRRAGAAVPKRRQYSFLAADSSSDENGRELAVEPDQDREAEIGERLSALITELTKYRTRRVADELVDTATTAIRSYATAPCPQVSKIDALLYRLKRAEAPLSLRFYNNLMWGYVQAREPQRAVDVFDDLPNPNVECYTTVAKALSHLQRPDDAIALLPEMRARAVKPNVRTYNAIIASCVRAGGLEKAREIFSAMEDDGVSPNVVSWNIIIDWHARQKKGAARLAGTAQAFADMKASGVKPNAVTYTTMMKSYAASGAINKAEGIFAEMKKRSPAITVDTESYNTLLLAHSSRLDWGRCLELLDEMQLSSSRGSEWKSDQAPSSLDGLENSSRPPSTSEFGSVGDDGFGLGGRSRSVSSRRNMLSGAPELMSQTPSAGSTALSSPPSAGDNDGSRVRPNSLSYALVVKACADAGRVRIAETVFDEMLADGISPPPPHAVVSLMKGYASMGDFSAALDMLKELKEWGISPNLRMMCTLMDACLKADEPELALRIYARIKASGTPPDVVTFTLLLRAYGATGELDKAFNVLKSMKRAGSTVSPNAATYNALVRACVATGACDRALKALSMALQDRCIDDRVYEALVSLEYGGDPSATDYLTFLLDAVQLVRAAGHTPNGVVYVALLEVCDRIGSVEVGRVLVRERRAGKFRVGRATASNARLYEESMRARADWEQ